MKTDESWRVDGSNQRARVIRHFSIELSIYCHLRWIAVFVWIFHIMLFSFYWEKFERKKNPIFYRSDIFLFHVAICQLSLIESIKMIS